MPAYIRGHIHIYIHVYDGQDTVLWFLCVLERRGEGPAEGDASSSQKEAEQEGPKGASFLCSLVVASRRSEEIGASKQMPEVRFCLFCFVYEMPKNLKGVGEVFLSFRHSGQARERLRQPV